MKEIIEKARELAIKEIETNGSPIFELFEHSNEMGQELAEKLNINKDIVMLGTLLMDIKLGKCLKTGEDHLEIGKEATIDFLEQFDLSQEIKNKIINCVEAHHGTIPFTCKEAEICANADSYRFLHPRSVFRFLMKLGEKGMVFEEAINFVEKKADEKHKILTLDICKEELEPHYRAIKQLIAKARE